MVRNRQAFAIGYLTGHHSILVDLAVVTAAVRLLKLGALFRFDDVRCSRGRRGLIQTTAQYADAKETRQLSENRLAKLASRVIIRYDSSVYLEVARRGRT